MKIIIILLLLWAVWLFQKPVEGKMKISMVFEHETLHYNINCYTREFFITRNRLHEVRISKTSKVVIPDLRLSIWGYTENGNPDLYGDFGWEYIYSVPLKYTGNAHFKVDNFKAYKVKIAL